MKNEKNLKYWKQALELVEINFSLNEKENHSNALKDILIKFIGLTLLLVFLFVSPPYLQNEMVNNSSHSMFFAFIMFSIFFIVSFFVVVFGIILISEILDYINLKKKSNVSNESEMSDRKYLLIKEMREQRKLIKNSYNAMKELSTINFDGTFQEDLFNNVLKEFSQESKNFRPKPEIEQIIENKFLDLEIKNV